MYDFEMLGQIVWSEREKQHMARKFLAEQIGYSDTQVGRLEKGEIKNPTYRMIIRIENVLHVNMQDEFLNFEKCKIIGRNSRNEKIIKLKD